MTQPTSPLAGKTLRILVVRHGQTDHNKKRILQGHLDTSLNKSGQAQAIVLGKYLKQNGVKIDAVFASDLQRVVTTTNLVVAQLGLIDPQSFEKGVDDKDGVESTGNTDNSSISDTDTTTLKNPNLTSHIYKVPTTFTPILRERYMGELESMVFDEAHAKAAREGKTFDSYGESHASVKARLRSVWEEIIDQAKQTHLAQTPENGEDGYNKQNGQNPQQWSTVLVVSHGGAISKLCADLVSSGAVIISSDSGLREESLVVPPNTSVTEFVVPLLDSENGELNGGNRELQYGQGCLVKFGCTEHLETPVETFQDEK